MKKIRWPKWTRSFSTSSKAGKLRKVDNEVSGIHLTTLNVNDEYNEVFRTKSYMEIWSKAEGQSTSLSKSSIDKLVSSSPSSSPLPFFVNLSDNLLEPRQDEVTELIKSSSTSAIHALLTDYFSSTLSACNLCELLLQSIHKIRSNNRLVKRTIKHYYTSDQFLQEAGILVKELAASFALLGNNNNNNPLSSTNNTADQFNEIHKRFSSLLHQLTSKHRKITRRIKLVRFFKKLLGYALVATCGVLAIALLVLAVHGVVGLVGGLLVTCSCGFTKARLKIKQATSRGELLRRLCTQLDVAARGVYILINQFDTIGRLVARLEYEVEHVKIIADMFAKNYNRSREISGEALRELENQEEGITEQLDELEKHVYLCFLAINRSRRLVIEQVMAPL